MGSVDKSEWNFLLCRKLNYLVSKLQTRKQQQQFLEDVGYDVMADTTPGKRLAFQPSFSMTKYRTHRLASRVAESTQRAAESRTSGWFAKRQA